MHIAINSEHQDTIQQRNYQIQSYEDRRQCRYWQQSGCLLDTMEKVCEGEANLDELISSTGLENIHLCCCPQPYKACQRSDADQLCLQLIEKYFSSRSYESKTKTANGIGDSTEAAVPRTTKPGVFEEATTVNPIQRFMQNLQTVRSELLESEDNCKELLATSEPLAKCSMVPSSKPFNRHDLICEMLSWQWEELGDGDKNEFERIGCPFVVKDKMEDGEAAERKGISGFIGEDNVQQETKMEL